MIPDPEKVREIAREMILNHAANLAQDDITVFESVIERDICIPLSVSQQEAFADDVLAEIGRAQVAVSWPDEQPQDERDRTIAEQADTIQCLRRMLGCACECPIVGVGCGCESPLCGCGACCWPDGERDADAGAVAAFFASDRLGPAMAALHDHFADRIAELDTRANPICEVPHTSDAEEEACERQRIATCKGGEEA